ncbi:hypothetical protein [Burkholderia sp. MBR-1]|uniref:hypothetical protein n=1 Tax=Burkholderia sp. MBR-1 TaxID=2732364 RepID=UPI0015EF8FF9|nr:hypothetical protein [Burkholderia sp. MBR-1]QMI49779.1 hypothetical protein MBR110_30380 [Burkholderia sp. MBR-1]
MTHVIREIALPAISATAMEHGLLNQLPPDVCHPSLTSKLLKPVFRAPDGLFLAEAVAVVYRDASGSPVDGGFFGYTTDGEVIRIALVDTERGINTDDDPKWTAFGLTMSLGKLLVQQSDGIRELQWSIVDFGLHQPNNAEHCPTPARMAVRAAFVPRPSA